MAVRKKIRKFILGNFMFDTSSGGLNDDASLLDNGVIDSTGVLEIVEFLEDEFGISVEDTELTRENLDSVNSLCRYLEKKGVVAAYAQSQDLC